MTHRNCLSPNRVHFVHLRGYLWVTYNGSRQVIYVSTSEGTPYCMQRTKQRGFGMFVSSVILFAAPAPAPVSFICKESDQCLNRISCPFRISTTLSST